MGRIVPEAEGLGAGTVETTKNGNEVTVTDIPKNGRFRFELEFFNEYSLNFKYPGHFNKIIQVSTQIPQEIWEKNSDFPPFPIVVQLLKEFEGIDKSFAQKPTGRIFYGKEIDNFEKESFMDDLQFVEQIETAKNKANEVKKEALNINKVNAQDLAVMQKNFDNLVKEADALYQRGEFQVALLKYLEAKKLFPDKAYPNDRIAELQDLVKALEITERQKAELEQKYTAAITKANSFFTQKVYPDSRKGYEEALLYKPGDVFATGRINEIDQILALLEKQKQYNDLIAKADNSYRTNKYDEAILFYTQAGLAVPSEQYPQAQIIIINQEKAAQAKLEQLDQEFNKNLQTANNQFTQKDYLQALNSYKSALSLKPDNKLVKDRIAETEIAIIAIENDKKYQEIIKLADQAFLQNDLQKAKIQYQEALIIKPAEALPKNRLAEITEIEAKQIKFNELVATATSEVAANRFDDALSLYNQALTLKPKDAGVIKSIEEIQNQKKQLLADKEFIDLIAQADKSFDDGMLDLAQSAYNKAAQLKKTDQYPKRQLQLIQNYQNIIKRADKSFVSKDYQASLLAYNEALTVKANDKYASGKITEIQGILDEKKQLEQKLNAELLAFNDAVKAADLLFNSNDYSGATQKYNAALGIKADEDYPKKKLKEIETILANIEKEKLRLEKEYQTLISLADKMFERKDFQNAKTEYQKAISLRTDDNYPKNQLKRIDDAIAENLRIEAENRRLQQEKIDAQFNQAMASGTKAFDLQDYSTASAAFKTALGIKKDDTLAKEKLGQSEAMIAQLARMSQAYSATITEANKQLTNKNYTAARDKYAEALNYKEDAEYPKTQITKIDELLAQIEAEAAKRKEFDIAVAQGETFLKASNLEKAKELYTTAYNLIPSEALPPKKISDINSLIAEKMRKEADAEATLNAYKNVIERADKHFNDKEYNSAKLVYNEALIILPTEKYPEDQLALIQKLLADQLEQNYKAAITKGDSFFNTNSLEQAENAYKEALVLKKDDKYAVQKINEILNKKAEIVAENNKLKQLNDQYNSLIADATNDFNVKEYLKSKDKYLKASVLKPTETFPKEQIAKIDQILDEIKREAELNQQYIQLVAQAQEAFRANKLSQAKDAFQKAFDLKPHEPLPPQRIAEIDKLIAQLDETAKLKALEEAQKLAKEKAERDRYNKFIADGDKSFGNKQYKEARLQYTNALGVYPTERYPKDQISKIDILLVEEENNRLLAFQQAQKDSLTKSKLRVFDGLMKVASDFEKLKSYVEAIAKYKEAIQILPERKPTVDKLIADIQDKISLAEKQNTEYARIIKLADRLFSESKLSNALIEYQNAITIKTDEIYPKNQIKEIQLLISKQDEKYSNLISQADKAFDNSDWLTAKTGYIEALTVKPNEVYPTNRLKIVNQKLSDQSLASISTSVESKAYADAIEKAEQALKTDQLNVAKLQFQVAQNIKPGEKLPVERIKEIDALIVQRNQAKLAQTQKELDEKYRQALSVADNSFREKSYTISKLQYQQALVIKPEESYPKNQIALIDNILNTEKARETYTPNLPALTVNQPVSRPLVYEESAQATEARALNYRTTNNYDEAVKKADDLFGIKDYTVARFYYYKANEIRKDEQYPLNQIELIRKLINSQLSGNDNSGYENAINLADAAFSKQNYSVAKFYYYKALDIKSWEKYPKDRIDEINALTNSLLSEKEEKEYREIIAKADEAYFNKDIAISRFYYNKARVLKRDEDYPKIKLKDIQNLIEQDNRDRLNIEYRQFIEEADRALQAENYSIARFNYNKALGIKPDENYPKDQLRRIRDALYDK